MKIRQHIAISAHNLGKSYRLYSSPTERLKQMIGWRFGKHYGHEFWALKEISFEIKKGERVGIIGRNGSGKSTLLQILAGTLTLTTGDFIINGRVGALLELGSGFNPEFNGRENVYLNGNVLGLTQTEISERFDDIAAFADIGEFIDQPLKTYSSGMLVRLAFAVQIFVPKSVLIVDEALSVGDEAFQRKCFLAIEKFVDDGGTLLLVSHNTQTIIRNCSRCLLLSNGKLIAHGKSKPITDLYQKLVFSPPSEINSILDKIKSQELEDAIEPIGDPVKSTNSSIKPSPKIHRSSSVAQDYFDPYIPSPTENSYGDGSASIINPKFLTSDGRPVNVLVSGRNYEWQYEIHFHKDSSQVWAGAMIKTVEGLLVAGLGGPSQNAYIGDKKAGDHILLSIPIQLNLSPGTYFMNCGVASNEKGENLFLHRRVDVAMIRVISPDSRGYPGIAYVAPGLVVEELNTPSL